jgi:hypothetical protein
MYLFIYNAAIFKKTPTPTVFYVCDKCVITFMCIFNKIYILYNQNIINLFVIFYFIFFSFNFCFLF